MGSGQLIDAVPMYFDMNQNQTFATQANMPHNDKSFSQAAVIHNLILTDLTGTENRSVRIHYTETWFEVTAQ